MSAMEQRHLFLCGAPRSGTTLLARLLGAHERVVMGIERYKFLYHKDAVWPEHFEIERFLEERAADTNIRQSDHMPDYARAREKFAAAIYVGDKVPVIFKFYRHLANRFPDARFVFIYRDPFAVANSWEVRARRGRPGWAAHKNYGRAIQVWNQSLRRTLAAAGKGLDIIVVSFHSLIEADWKSTESYMGDLQATLGLQFSERVHRSLRAEWARSSKLRRRRSELEQDRASAITGALDSSAIRAFFAHFRAPAAGLPRAVRNLLNDGGSVE